MPCQTIEFKTSNGERHEAIICGSRGVKRCKYCNRIRAFLCDFPVGKTKRGKLKTCDAPLCEDHTQKGDDPQYDFCRLHYPHAKAAAERRKARQSTEKI